jgi:hypothetical protein
MMQNVNAGMWQLYVRMLDDAAKACSYQADTGPFLRPLWSRFCVLRQSKPLVHAA